MGEEPQLSPVGGGGFEGGRDEAFELAALTPVMVALAGLRPLAPFSYGRGVADLVESIRATGLLRPLLILEHQGQPFLLAGGRRREALMSLGRSEAPALILPTGFPLEKAMALGLADNQERGWNQAETALVWHFLCDELGPERAEPLSFFLGLGRSPKLRQWSLSAAGLSPEALTAMAEERLDLECGARLAHWSLSDREAALNLFEALLPSKQKKKQWLDWLEDVARREKISPAQILAAEEIVEAQAQVARLGRPAAEEGARRYLWSRRHPALAEMVATRRERVRALGLPPAARLELDPTFEDLKFSLELTFSAPSDFAKLAEVVAGLVSSPDFQQLLDDTPHDQG